MINYTEQEEKKESNLKNQSSGTVALGIVLIIVGAIFILNNLNIISYAWRHFILSWQMLLIAIGIVAFCKGNKPIGTVLILVGGFFILPKISMLWPEFTLFGPLFTRNFWPLLIIACGIGLIVTAQRRHNVATINSNRQSTENTVDNNGYINYNFVFSGTDQIFTGPVFKGGDIRATFGGIKLDLRKTSLPDNGPVYLNIEATFGGVDIIVPEQWDVVIHQNSFFGGFSDKRYSRPSYSSDSQKLIINAKCTFGGGEVK